MTRPWRESYDLPGVDHGGLPIPMATRVGNMLFSSGVSGTDPSTRKVAAGAEAQADWAFKHMDALLTQAGATLGDVARVTVYIVDASIRVHVDREWVKRFPDPQSRPARHTILRELGSGKLLQMEFVAVIEALSHG
jgi:2-iminobutanoate/2-iminopropanoate deaminase